MTGGLLLDTHAWIWYAGADETHLSERALTEIEASRRQRRLFVSSISVWEFGMLVAKGRISVSMPIQAWVKTALAAPGVNLLALDADVALESTQLPGDVHGDPADRFLIATARVHRLRLVTADRRICEYAEGGRLNVLPL